MPLSPATRALLAVLRAQPDREFPLSTVADLDAGDRTALLRALRTHGLSGRAHSVLRRAEITLPDDLARALTRDHRVQTASSIVTLACYRKFSQTLSRARVEHVPLKGIRLLTTIYRDDPGARPVGDIDALVRYGDLGEAERVLTAAGFIPASASERELDARYQHHHHYTARTGPDEVRIELHWRHSIELGQLRDADRLWDGAHPADPDPDSTERVLDPTTELHVQLVHLASHGFRTVFKWTQDIRLLLEAQAGGTGLPEASRVEHLARQESTMGACYYALSLVHHVGGSLAADALAARLRPHLPQPRALLLDRFARPSFLLSRTGGLAQRLPVSVMACMLPDRWTERSVASARAIGFRLHRLGLERARRANAVTKT